MASTSYVQRSSFAFVNSDPVLLFTRLGASEVPTWIALPAIVALLFGASSQRASLAGAALLGFSLLGRMNQAPGILLLFGILVVGVARRRLLGAVYPVLLFGAFAAFPALHNLYYGGQLAALPTSAAIPENYEIRPTRLLVALWTGGPSLAPALEKLRLMFHFVPREAGLLEVATHGLQLVWLIVLVALLVSRRVGWQANGVGVLPPCYLAVHLFFQILVYYPRHIIIGHLAMGMVAVYGAAVLARKVDDAGSCRPSLRE